MRVTQKMRRRSYCPTHRTRIGTVKEPGICPDCGAAGVPFEVARQMRHQASAIRRGKTPRKIVTSRELQRRREIYNAYLDTPQWQQIRKLVIARDGGCCLICFSSQSLHVHHLHYKTFGDETGEELATLCKPCHQKEHRRSLRGRLVKGPMEAVRNSTAGAELDAEFAERIAREA